MEEKQQEALNALENAAELYEEYLRLTEISDLNTLPDEPTSVEQGWRSWNHPLDVRFVAEGSDAFLG